MAQSSEKKMICSTGLHIAFAGVARVAHVQFRVVSDLVENRELWQVVTVDVVYRKRLCSQSRQVDRQD